MKRISTFLIACFLTIVALVPTVGTSQAYNYSCDNSMLAASTFAPYHRGQKLDSTDIIYNNADRTKFLHYSADLKPHIPHPYHKYNYISYQFHPLGEEGKCAAILSKNKWGELIFWGVEKIGTHVHSNKQIATVSSIDHDAIFGFYILVEDLMLYQDGTFSHQNTLYHTIPHNPGAHKRLPDYLLN